MRPGHETARRPRRAAAPALAALVGLLAGPAGLSAQTERAPLKLPFGWEVATPSSQGIDPQGLEAVSRRAEAGEFGAVHSLLVVRGGRLVFERYYHGWDMNQMHTIQSVTKSVTSALIGIAIAEGKIKSVDQPISDFFPEHRDLFTDPRKQRLTLRHVLTMTVGNDWDEHAIPYSNPANIVWRMAMSEDWMGFVLKQPMVAEPGKQFAYSSGAALLLSGIIQKATGMQASVYAERKLFDPLAIPVYGWYRNVLHPAHWSHTGGGLNLRPRDLAKIGYLYVNGGRWKGKEIIPESWVKESTRPHLHTPDTTRWYGYQWWLQKLPPASATTGDPVEVIEGRGWGGQFVVAIPRLDFVAVATSGSFEDESIARRGMTMILEHIVPLVRATDGKH